MCFILTVRGVKVVSMFHPRLVPQHLCTLFVTVLVSAPTWAAVAGTDLIAEIRPLLTTFGDPADNIVGPGQGFDGVAKLRINRSDGLFSCTGTLLNGGQDILTAAHCLTDDQGVFITNSVSVIFELPGASATFSTT